MRKWLVLAGVVVLVAAITSGYILIFNSKKGLSFISSEIKKQLNFATVLVDSNQNQIIADKATVKYDQSIKLLSYNASYKGNKLTVSLQASPDGFSDTPQVFDAFIEKFRGYDSFDSKNGTVHLTHPVELNGGQTAVMNSRGVLLFIKPTNDLSIEDWKAFFNNLTIN